MNHTEKILHDKFNDAAYIILDFLCSSSPSLYDACKSGYYEKITELIVQLIIEIKEKNLNKETQDYVNFRKNGNIESVDSMINSVTFPEIQKFGSYYSSNWYARVEEACQRDDLKEIKSMFGRPNNIKRNCWNEALKYACTSGHLQIIRYLFEKRPNYYRSKDILIHACNTGNVETIQLVLEFESPEWTWDYSYALHECRHNIEIIQLFDKKNKDDNQYPINKTFIEEDINEIVRVWLDLPLYYR